MVVRDIMTISPFGHSKRQAHPKIVRGQQPRPDERTLNDFSGGLNLADEDVFLNTSFAKELINAHRDLDGSMSFRFGTKLWKDWNGVATGSVVGDPVYFRDKAVVFTTTGQILTITDAGVATLIWSNAIAALLPGAPTGWTATDTISTTEFRNELVVCNGVDKPIIISRTHTVTYLQDLATGSNINTPIGRFVTTVGNYCIIAGITAAPDDLYISAQGTSGTWVGDPAPNDGVSINIAAYSAKTGGDMRGLSSFRNFLVVHFASSSIIVVLGEYNVAVHVPRVSDTLAKQGIISHRMATVLDQDIAFADDNAVYKAKRNVFGEALETTKMSERVQKDFVADVPDTQADRWKSFTANIQSEGRIVYALFNGTDYNMYVLSFDNELKKRAWSRFEGWAFTGSFTSSRNRVFFCIGTKIFQYGNDVFTGEDYAADFLGEYDSLWLTATGYVVDDRVLEGGIVYRCLVDHVSTIFAVNLASSLWEVYTGENIDVDWEFPWANLKSRMKKKRLSYIMFDTVYNSTFTIQIYTDKIRYDENGDDDPALEMIMTGGDSPGYGGGDQPYGGGRRTSDERMWGFPCEFKVMKLRIIASTKRRLKLSAISLAIAMGNFKR